MRTILIWICLFLFLSSSVVAESMTITLGENHITSSSPIGQFIRDGLYPFDVAPQVNGQTFKIENYSNAVLDQITIRTYRNNAGGESCNISVYEVDGSGYPIESEHQGTYNFSDSIIPSSVSYVDINISSANISLSSSKTYAILFSCSDNNINMALYGDQIDLYSNGKGIYKPSSSTTWFDTSTTTGGVYDVYMNLTYVRSIESDLNISVLDLDTENYIYNSTITIIGEDTYDLEYGSIIIPSTNISDGNYSIIAEADDYSVRQKLYEYISTNDQNNLVFYLLEENSSNGGTLNVRTYDNFEFVETGVDVRLLEYNYTLNSFVEIDQCTSNINGECVFEIELGTKLYVVTGSKVIGDSLIQARSSESGEIISIDAYQINLRLYDEDLYSVPSLTDFYITATNTTLVETVINSSLTHKVSYLGADFYDYAGNTNTVCISYSYINRSITTPLANGTQCVTAESGTINVAGGYNLTTILQTYSVLAEVYVNNSGDVTTYQQYIYQGDTSFEQTSGGLVPYMIMGFFLVILAIAMYTSNIYIFVILSIVGTVFMTSLFPSFINWRFAAVIIVACIGIGYLSRKQEGNIGI